MGEFWGLDGVNGFAAFNFMLYIAMRYRLDLVGAMNANMVGSVTCFADMPDLKKSLAGMGWACFLPC